MTPLRRRFGIGRDVSVFTLGTMRALSSPKQMLAVVRAALAAGINHIETAPAYGPAENFLGSALQELYKKGEEPSGGWVITSKLLPGVDLNDGKRQLEAILQRLGIAKLDNLAVHGLNQPEHLNWVIEGEGGELLRWAQAQGLVTQVGFSSHGSYPLIQEAIESGHFQFCSLHLHLLDPERIPLADKALQSGMGVMAISPADKGGRLQAPSQTLIDDCNPFHPLELAYRFLLARGFSTLTLGAASASDLLMAHSMMNLTGPLDPKEQKAIEQVRSNSYQRLAGTHCNQCRACLPCPNDVPIPELLRLRNLRIGHDLKAFTEERYNLIGRAGHWWEKIDASSCEHCGKCLPHCPDQLAIPDLLAETHQLLAATPRRRLWS